MFELVNQARQPLSASIPRVLAVAGELEDLVGRQPDEGPPPQPDEGPPLIMEKNKFLATRRLLLMLHAAPGVWLKFAPSVDWPTPSVQYSLVYHMHK